MPRCTANGRLSLICAVFILIQFRLLCEEWKQGLVLLEGVTWEFTDIATACYIQLKSAYHQIQFVQLRDQLITAEKAEGSLKSFSMASSVALRHEILALIRKETELARKMYSLMLQWPEIGFEAANHYYFNIEAVMEKIVNPACLEEYYTISFGHDITP